MSVSKFIPSRQIIVIIAVLLSILLLTMSGCIKKTTLDPTRYIEHPAWTMEATDTFQNTAPCSVFYCKNASVGIFKKIFTWVTFGLYSPKPSLEEGSCWFESVNLYTEEGQKRINATLNVNNTDEYPRYFMIGSGPNIAAAEEARRYCGGSLGFALQWLRAVPDDDVPSVTSTVSTESLRELLRADVIPFVAYHTPTDAGAYTKSLSQNLSNIGPVFVAPGAEYSILDQHYVDPIGHFQIIKTNCANCLTVAFVKFNDTATIEHYNTTGGMGVMQYIDVIGYGIDANQFDCDRNAIVAAIDNFSETIAERWKKPTIIPYIRAEVKGNCTEENIARLYSSLYANIPFFVQEGIVGFGTDDTPSRFKIDGNLDVAGVSWFKSCSAYYDQRYPETSQVVPIIFPEGGDIGGHSPCTMATSMDVWAVQSCDITLSAVSIPEPVDSSVYVGDFCLDNKEFAVDSGPFVSIDPTAGEVLDGYEKYCEIWSQPIRQFVSEEGFDQSFVRGIIWQENGFTQYNQIMITQQSGEGDICSKCTPYMSNAMAYQICCGTTRLKYYYNESYVIDQLYQTHDTPSVCGGEPAWAKLYFAILGYREGSASFNSALDNLKKCIQNDGCYDEELKRYTCPFSFDNTHIKELIAGARDMRTICKLCTDRKTTSDPNWAVLPSPHASQKPLTNPQCILPFKTEMGMIWNSGIILEDSKGAQDVFSIADGIVADIKTGPRKGKEIIIQSSMSGEPLFITYSSLSETGVNKNDYIKAGDIIGRFDRTLRLEICRGMNCTNPAIGINRNFIDPASFIGIECPSE
jgi:hypothetical protein